MDTDCTLAYIGLGANLGDASAALHAALRALAQLRGTQVCKVSHLYRTQAIDAPGPDFLNAVAQLSTSLGADELLTQLHAIELQHGRERSERNAPRTLDLDLLLYGTQCIHAPGLDVPHPRLHQRAFVLVPLAELDPELVIPGRGPVRALLPAVAGQGIAAVEG